MTHFQPIINQIAESLNITTDLANQMLESYPQLIKEYQMYHMLDLIKSTSELMGVIAIGFSLIVIYSVPLVSKDDSKKIKIPFIKTQLAMLSLSAVAYLVSQILMIKLTPHIHFIITHITK